VRVREAAGRRGLVAPLLALLLSCSSGPETGPAVSLESARTPAQLRSLLDSIASRSDLEAMMGRARIYNRLRELESAGSPTLLALADAADIDVLSHGGSPAYKAESAARLAAHFRERAENPVLSRSSFPGHLGEPLRKIVLLTIASFFGESASRKEAALSLEHFAAAANAFADKEALSPEAVRLWRKRSGAASTRASELGSGTEPLEPSVDARKFAEYEAGRHLEEGTRAADLGTREKAARAEMEGVLQWYLLALAHYGVVRETQGTPTPAEEHALAAQEIVVRSLCDLLCREP
jgi:hypothetical protein